MRLIEAEELKHILNNSKYYGTKAGNDFADMITECTSIVGRKKGKWMTVENPNYSPFDCSAGKISVCSVCGYAREQYDFNYCPNCGARMDEKETPDAEVHSS